MNYKHLLLTAFICCLASYSTAMLNQNSAKELKNAAMLNAAAHGTLGELKAAIANGADINGYLNVPENSLKTGGNALDLAVDFDQNNENLEKIAYLIYQTDIDIKGSEVLIFAVAHQKNQMAKLLATKLDVNNKAKNGTTALYWAITMANNELIDVLLAARPNLKESGSIELNAAVRSRNKEIFFRLLDLGADVISASKRAYCQGIVMQDAVSAYRNSAVCTAANDSITTIDAKHEYNTFKQYFDEYIAARA